MSNDVDDDEKKSLDDGKKIQLFEAKRIKNFDLYFVTRKFKQKKISFDMF